jgi:hypothetical protein
MIVTIPSSNLALRIGAGFQRRQILPAGALQARTGIGARCNCGNAFKARKTAL